MKASGAEIMDFFREWPPGDDYCSEDRELNVGGVDDQGNMVLDSLQTYETDDFGWVCWQGDGEAPGDPEVFTVWFQRWREAQAPAVTPVDKLGVVLTNDERREAARLLAHLRANPRLALTLVPELRILGPWKPDGTAYWCRLDPDGQPIPAVAALWSPSRERWCWYCKHLGDNVLHPSARKAMAAYDAWLTRPAGTPGAPSDWVPYVLVGGIPDPETR